MSVSCCLQSLTRANDQETENIDDQNDKQEPGILKSSSDLLKLKHNHLEPNNNASPVSKPVSPTKRVTIGDIAGVSPDNASGSSGSGKSISEHNADSGHPDSPDDDGLGPLPPNWEKAFTDKGEPYFIDHNTGE